MWLRLPGATAIVVAAAFAALAQPAPDTSPVVSLTVLNPTQPVAGDGSTGEVAYVPDTAGPSSALLATYDDSTQSSARKQLFVEIDDTHGHALFFRAQTDTAHRLLFAPVNGAARVTLFKSFTRDRKPDATAVRDRQQRTGRHDAGGCKCPAYRTRDCGSRDVIRTRWN